MGFTKDKVLEALTVSDGNKDNAANYLMNNAGKWVKYDKTINKYQKLK